MTASAASSVQVVIALQKPLAHAAVGSVGRCRSPPHRRRRARSAATVAESAIRVVIVPEPTGSAPRRARAPARSPRTRARGAPRRGVARSSVATTRSVAPEPSEGLRGRATPARRACQLDVTRTTSSAPSVRAARATPIALPSVVRAPRSTSRARAGAVQARAIRSASASRPAVAPSPRRGRRRPAAASARRGRAVPRTRGAARALRRSE